MRPKEFRKSGEILFGPRWQTDIARALKVDPRRVRQWVKGDRPLPNTIDEDIFQLLNDRLLKIVMFLDFIKTISQREILNNIGVEMKKGHIRIDKKSLEKGYQAGLHSNPDTPGGVEVLSWYFGYTEGKTDAIKIEKQQSLTKSQLSTEKKIDGERDQKNYGY